MQKIFLVAVVLALSACSTFTPQRYSIRADTNAALKTIDAGNINVGSFKGPSNFNSHCRAVGPIAPPDNMSFETYIQNALADELKVAGKYNGQTPKITLSGTIEQLAFSSTRGLTGGSWDIAVKVSSSNGKSILVSEHYEFNSGFMADTACKQTAEAYLPAVQDLIGKLVMAPEFKSMVTP